MKEVGNKEIDLLLRDLAKRERSAPLDVGNHLEPDELSSLAEGVLPESTRALYTAHLADCENCRKIVAQLMVASGATIQVKSETAKAGLWSYISKIFTPAGLRFAVPALWLIIIAAFGLMLKQRQEEKRNFVAQVNEQPAAPAASDTNNQQGESSKQPSSGLFTIYDSSQEKQKAAKADTGRADASKTETERSGEKTREETKEEAKAADTTANEQRPAESRERAAASSGRAAANTPAPAAPAEPTPTPAPAKAQDEQPKRGWFGRLARSTDTLSKREERKVRDQEAADKKAEAQPEAENEVTVRGAEKNKDDDAVETRTVSGRRFRRGENGWIDTAYNSSTALTNVARASEQYRVLVGDEPGLRAIAEQLDGQVIVVWKGKAYRIR